MFPQFNIHSTPLLVLIVQGIVFAFLLAKRYRRDKVIADLLIVAILLVMVYGRTTYTIGFMGWYDTFKNTKINYYLIPLGLAIGPLIYLYIRTLIKAPFTLNRRDIWHFIPVAIYILYRLIILLIDAQSEDWDVGYEGHWFRTLHVAYIEPITEVLTYSSQLLYFAFAIQLFARYRSRIYAYFSNTYKLELNWIRNFLIVYVFLFIYSYSTDIVDLFIVELDYVHNWWYHLFSAIAIVYLGMMAYFTDLRGLQSVAFDLNPTANGKKYSADSLDREMNTITTYVESQASWLNPNFTLRDLATGVNMGLNEVSEVINNGFGSNFNEWINTYRVEEVKKKLRNSEFDHMSLVGLAFDCGFNSKATFNRVFKKITGLSPSQYKATHRK